MPDFELSLNRLLERMDRLEALAESAPRVPAISGYDEADLLDDNTGVISSETPVVGTATKGKRSDSADGLKIAGQVGDPGEINADPHQTLTFYYSPLVTNRKGLGVLFGNHGAGKESLESVATDANNTAGARVKLSTNYGATQAKILATTSGLEIPISPNGGNIISGADNGLFAEAPEDTAWEAGDNKQADRTDDHTVASKYVWKFKDGRTIGDASSGASWAAAAAQDLFLFYWAKCDNTACPVSGGRGASAAADWAAHKTLTIPDCRRRFSAGAYAGGADATLLGHNDGVATVADRPVEALDHLDLFAATTTATLSALTHTISGPNLTGNALDGTYYTGAVYDAGTPYAVQAGTDYNIAGAAHTHPLPTLLHAHSVGVADHAAADLAIVWPDTGGPSGDPTKHEPGYLAVGNFVLAQVL